MIGYFILAILVGYFIGAIPFGLIYVKLFTGKDIREVGSGRMGGTNSLRAGGWGVGFATALSDVFKGYMSVIVISWLLSGTVSEDMLPWVQVFTGISAVFGHNWSVFYGFKGGAGTGPNVGWATAIWFPMFPIAFALMFSLIYFLGIASVASMLMGLVIPIGFGILYFTGSAAVFSTPAYMIGGIVTASVVAFALRGNFQRLLRGEERVVGFRARRMKKQEEEKEQDAA